MGRRELVSGWHTARLRRALGCLLGVAATVLLQRCCGLRSSSEAFLGAKEIRPLELTKELVRKSDEGPQQIEPHSFAPSVGLQETADKPCSVVAYRQDLEEEPSSGVSAEELAYPEDREAAVKKKARAPPNTTMLETSGQKTPHSHLTALNPPWAQCFVESWETERTVLEEWVMRDERNSVKTFKAWRENRESGDDPVTLRCEPVMPSDEEEVRCLECVAQRQVGWLRALAGVSHESFQVVATNTDLQSCLQDAITGTVFCKRGTVAAVL